MKHASKDHRRLERMRKDMETMPLHVTDWGDVIVWMGDGFYARTTDGVLVLSQSRGELKITRKDILQ